MLMMRFCVLFFLLCSPVFAVTVSTNQIVFGEQPVGTHTATQKLTLTNQQANPQRITGIFVSGDYRKVASDCPPTLAPGESCFLSVLFAPAEEGPRSGAIEVSAAESATRIELSGVGTRKTETLTWPPALGTVKGYRIYSGRAPGDVNALYRDVPLSTDLFPAQAPSLRLDLAEIGQGEVKCFRVSAYNSAGESGKSDPVCFDGT